MFFRSIKIKFVQLPLDDDDEAITIDCDMCKRCHKKCAITTALFGSLMQRREGGGGFTGSSIFKEKCPVIKLKSLIHIFWQLNSTNEKTIRRNVYIGVKVLTNSSYWSHVD